MLVSAASKMTFIHVQKTGGRSVNQVLWEHFSDLTKFGRRHGPLSESLLDHPELGENFVFGFVRNPWDRLVSWYSMIAAAHESERHARHLATNTFWQDVRNDFEDFGDFVSRGVGDSEFRPKRYRRLRMPQTQFFTDVAGEFGADFIGRTERLNHDLVAVMERFDISLAEVPRVNTSAHAHYGDYYSDASRMVVARVYAEDIDRFGYKY